jgi:flagellar hook-basal body complex protein FliE
MSVPAIESALVELRSLSALAGSPETRGSQVATSVGQGGFADALLASIERINALQQNAAGEVRAFESGSDPDLTLDTVMLDVQKASLAFQMGTQVRNRLVGAYREIMNMQV